MLFNAASISFPLAERFGIAAVKDCRPRIKDPILLKQMGDLLYQEAMHDRVHTACNEMLARHNPRCSRAGRAAQGAFRFLSRMPLAFRISVVVGMEHIAALLAEVVLQHADYLHDKLPAPVVDLWVWHAIEETEHKAVCFDVHAAGVGTGFLAYVNRVLGMLTATPLFLLIMLGAGAVAQGSPKPPTASPQSPAADTSSDVPRGGPGVLGILRTVIPWRQYFSYYRPSFHPWQHDNSQFVAKWKAGHPYFGLAPAATDPAHSQERAVSPAQARAAPTSLLNASRTSAQ